MFYSNFVLKTQRFRLVITVTLKPGLGSLKVIVTDTDRSAVTDFLLTFHSNHGPISYHFRDKQRYREFYPPPVYFALPLKGSPWNSVAALEVKN